MNTLAVVFILMQVHNDGQTPQQNADLGYGQIGNPAMVFMSMESCERAAARVRQTQAYQLQKALDPSLATTCAQAEVYK